MLQKVKNIYHLFQALIANFVYGFPSTKIKVIGISGTDGKTTTTHLIYHILKSAGKKVSIISSVYADIGGNILDTGFHVTTPDSFPLQKLIKASVTNGDEYLILETTSHAIDQNRVAGIKYFIGVITNITHEHLDYHKTYIQYLQTKSRLFDYANIALINSDDGSFSHLKKILHKKEIKVYQYGFKHKSNFNFNFKKRITRFNRYNYLAGFSVATILGINDSLIYKALDSFQLPPGRLETIYDKQFKVIIDFAHTPNAFRQLLPEIRIQYLRNKDKLIHVFGAASERDTSKRPLMGKESSRYADYIILTEEDCRKENADKICKEIAAGIENDKDWQIITDRRKAIEKAINIAQIGDVVLLTGKGHEKSLCRGKIEFPWSEHNAVINALALRKRLTTDN
ncbi:MAG: UDP-N-acetylmuramyl-tripeptide synthetase [Candidatus Roizmanbacteria bacterium GW2011_GWA2_36_23]|uniref:UDP-N-acetylmuramyl-tripeptide synthetase n=1 Tax=Candidatus Roizmanbacteria bacterium GW2011_GWA2_36_23 TaxID=1618480 RepID=A0A0G0E4V3_9BACT|nr:MAG: UDP-N-acetylmuramyl-tripeptide synthetase [Candidatus Roizmanbacteria bacterium GW2011_GWA2_36_23]